MVAAAAVLAGIAVFALAATCPPVPARAPSTAMRATRSPGPSRLKLPPKLVVTTAVAAASLVGALRSPLLSLLFAALVVGTHLRRARHQRDAGRSRVQAHLPELTEAVAVAVAAGFSVGEALRLVAHEVPGAVAEAVGAAVSEADRGRVLADALADRLLLLGDTVQPLLNSLLESERYGVPAGPALERAAVEYRAAFRRRAEEHARRVPVRLLFPLVVCVLPASVLLTVAPAVAGAVRSLNP